MDPFQFKYENEADALQDECDCPPEEAAAIKSKVVVFRFVFDECDDDSFVPQGVSRPSDVANKPCQTRCRYLALSFYQDKRLAEDAHRYFAGSFKRFVELAGTCLAKGHLEAGDGLVLGPSRDSHIELFEDENVQLSARFQVVQDLT